MPRRGWVVSLVTVRDIHEVFDLRLLLEPEAAAQARPFNTLSGIALGLRSASRVLIYNLIALPLYVVLLVTGVGTLILFVVVNGIAFGRDLGEMIASRHGDRPSRHAWLGMTRG